MSANLFTPLPNDSFATAIGLTGTPARSPAATTARPRRPASRPSRPTPEGRRSGTGSGLRPPAPCGSRPRARPSTPCSGSTAARRSPRSRRSRATTTWTRRRGWSLLEAKVKRGVTYRIAVDGQNIGAGPGQGLATLGYRYWPANDGFAQATKLSGKKGKKVSSNAGAGRQSKEPRKVAGKRAGQSVWYVYRAKRAGRLTIDLSGSKFNTLLGVYTGKKITKLHKVAANDNGGKGRSSRLTFRGREGHEVPHPGRRREDGGGQAHSPLDHFYQGRGVIKGRPAGGAAQRGEHRRAEDDDRDGVGDRRPVSKQPVEVISV